MLAELFIRRLEIMLQASRAQSAANSRSRFVPVQLPVNAAGDDAGDAPTACHGDHMTRTGTSSRYSLPW